MTAPRSPGRAPVPFVPRRRPKALAGRLADALLTPIAPLLARAGKRPPRPRVLVVRPDHLGDAVMATAVLGPLRDALAPSALDVLCGPWARDVFAGHPAVSEVIEVELPWWLAARGAPLAARAAAWARLPGAVRRVRRRRYDVVVELRGDLRQILLFAAWSGATTRVGTDRTGGRALLTDCWPFDQTPHEVEKAAHIAALVGAGRLARPVITPPDAPSAAVEGAWRLSEGRPRVLLALRGTEANRAWPVGHAAELCRRLRAAGAEPVLTGARRDAAYARSLREAGAPFTDLVGRTAIADLAWVASRCAVAVCTDSGPMHVAAAVGTPVVALFGPGDPGQSRPWAPGVTVLGRRSPCGCVHPWCDLAHQRGAPGECLREILPEEVAAEVLPRLGVAPGGDTSFP